MIASAKLGQGELVEHPLVHSISRGCASKPPSSLFAATVFIAGAAVGMGGLFITQRVRTPPAAVVLRETLAKPLLPAKAEAGYEEGTALGGVRASTYTPYTAA